MLPSSTSTISSTSSWSTITFSGNSLQDVPHPAHHLAVQGQQLQISNDEEGMEGPREGHGRPVGAGEEAHTGGGGANHLLPPEPFSFQPRQQLGLLSAAPAALRLPGLSLQLEGSMFLQNSLTV